MGSPSEEDFVGDDDWVSVFSSWMIILEMGSGQGSQICCELISFAAVTAVDCGLRYRSQPVWGRDMVGEHTQGLE